MVNSDTTKPNHNQTFIVSPESLNGLNFDLPGKWGLLTTEFSEKSNWSCWTNNVTPRSRESYCSGDGAPRTGRGNVLRILRPFCWLIGVRVGGGETIEFIARLISFDRAHSFVFPVEIGLMTSAISCKRDGDFSYGRRWSLVYYIRCHHVVTCKEY